VLVSACIGNISAGLSGAMRTYLAYLRPVHYQEV
jgi:hypothetical protein